MRYTPSSIEKKWQAIWEKENTFAASEDTSKPVSYTHLTLPTIA